MDCAELQRNKEFLEGDDWIGKPCEILADCLQNVAPDPRKSCGPYQPVKRRGRRQVKRSSRVSPWVDENNHDTIGLIAIDKDGNIAGGTTTNGMNHKVPG